MTDRTSPKIFCIGFQKTGTSSMRDALGPLGYKVAGHYGTELELGELRESYVATGLELAREYDVVQDMPWPLIYRELDAVFPNAKFIYTTRDTDNWYRSMVKHFGTRPTPMRQLVYGEDCPFPEGNEERYKSVYEEHRAAVLEYFADRPHDFVVLDLEKGDGWPELGAFLGLKNVPDGPFVHSNKAEMRTSLPYRFRRARNKVRHGLRKVLGFQEAG